MVLKTESRMEVIFGLCGALFMIIMLPITAFITPGYSPLNYAVSNLGEMEAKSLYSIVFVVSGSLGIPFYIYLEKELVNINETLRRVATGLAIFTNMCIALVGIIPDETYIAAFVTFHAFVALTSFIGSSLYIVLYSYLMYLMPKSLMYEGPAFKKYLAFYGFFIGIILIIFFFTGFAPIIEWILTILILIWVIITASQCISYKFFNLPGVYYKKDQYPEALERFEEAIKILNDLKIKGDPIKKTIKENIKFLRNELEKEHNNSDESSNITRKI